MLPPQVYKISYFWPKSAKKILVKGVQKTEKTIEKKIEIFCSENQFSVSYMNCANILGPSDHS